MAQTAIRKDINNWRKAIEAMPEKMREQAREKAMELISDYPLYVSGLSNISYTDAILIALVTGESL